MHQLETLSPQRSTAQCQRKPSKVTLLVAPDSLSNGHASILRHPVHLAVTSSVHSLILLTRDPDVRDPTEISQLICQFGCFFDQVYVRHRTACRVDPAIDGPLGNPFGHTSDCVLSQVLV